MSIQIHINGEDATEAIRELSVLASHLSPSAGSVKEVATTSETQKPEKNTRSRSSKPINEAPVKEEIADRDNDVDNTSSDPVNGSEGTDDTEQVPTVVELRAKAQEVGTSPERKKKIKELLDKFKSKSISDVPEDKRAAFLKGLGVIRSNVS